MLALLKIKCKGHDTAIKKIVGNNPNQAEPQFLPSVRDTIQGECVSTRRRCKTCVAMTNGTALRRCQYAYSSLSGHLFQDEDRLVASFD